jgi:succinoglycan biosynthesis protein ExoW
MGQPRVAVVIPYFQREAGILRKVIASVFRQRGEFSCEIVVVDDGSPIPAEVEIEETSVTEPRMHVRLIKQDNAGPGAARNAGLATVSDEVLYVAFLDSDDEWAPDHLQNAIRGLELGYDFYFSDHLFADYKENSAFVRAGKITPKDHRLLDAEHSIYEYRGDMVDQILVKGNVIGTSTVVYRFRPYADLRFREAFYNGQDYLFWLDFSQRSCRFVFSTRVECDYGKGLNIYAGAGWATSRSLIRLKNELQLWCSVPHFYSLTDQQYAGVIQKIDRVRESIVRDILHRLSHRKPISTAVLREVLRVDPQFPRKSLRPAFRIAKEKLLAGRKSANATRTSGH